MEKLYNYVYITVNKINGKCYVGSHGSYTQKDTYLGSGNLILQSVKKYGKQNFVKIILKHYNSILEARLNEGFYVEKFDTAAPHGYNISPAGGSNFKDGIASKETREKLRQSHKNKKHSEEWNKNVSIALTGRKRNPEDAKKAWKTKKDAGNYEPWNKGKTDIYTETTLNKIRNSRKNTSMLPETRKKIQNSLKEKIPKVNQIKIECEYCHKILNLGNYHRWHGKNCKHK